MKITASEVYAFLKCRRAWRLRYAEGWGKAPDPGAVGPLQIGTLVHTGVEAWYNSLDRGAALDAAEQAVQANIEALLEAGREGDVSDVRKAGDLVEIMLDGYVDWLEETGADAGIQVTGAEQIIETRGVGDCTLLGKLDWQGTIEGAPLIFDAKTCMTALDQEIQGPMSLQFKHYSLIWYLLHDEIPEIRIRWMRKVKRTARAVPPFYGEVAFKHSPSTLMRYGRQLDRIVEDMQRERQEQRVAILPTASRECPSCTFFPVCSSIDTEFPDAVDDMLMWSYTQTDPLERYRKEETA